MTAPPRALRPGDGRRRFLGALLAASTVTPICALAQRPLRVYRIGYLHPGSTDDRGGAYAALKEALAGLGFVVGRNLAIEERFAEGRGERLAALAADLVARKVDLIVAVAPAAIRAAHDATTTIPIVMAFSGDDPVKLGFVASYAHPGGNVTGMTSLTSDLAPKWIELLGDALPGIRRIAVLQSAVRPDHAEHVALMQTVAKPRAIELVVVEGHTPARFPAAFDEMAQRRAQGVIILSGPEYADQLALLAELAASHRLPSLWQYRDFAVAGGLFAYGPSIRDLSARAAEFVAKILDGVSPAALPVQGPTTFHLVINAVTARRLDVTIPQSLLVRADEVIR